MLKRLLTIAFVFIFSFLIIVPSALAAKPDGAGGGSKPDNGGGKPDEGGGSNFIGYDVSWPQCGKTLPTDQAFGIVGVNGGLATTPNECLADQLTWAHGSTGITLQDKAQLYVNTANPGQVLEQYGVTSWPTSNVDPLGNSTLNNSDGRYNNPYGECVTTSGTYGSYTNSLACSWQYGWDRAVQDVHEIFIPAADAVEVDKVASNYFWWLDVETENSWQTGSAIDLAKNTATLEGMTAYLQGVIGANVGIYSTSYQWGQIVGNTVQPGSNLNGKDSWLAGARNEKDARNRCSSSRGLTAGSQVSLVQFVSKNLDHNASCL